MPIYTQTYRTFDGEAPGRFRWLVVARQELRILLGQRAFLFIGVAAYLHVCLRILQLVVIDMMANTGGNLLLNEMRNFSAMNVDATMFFTFLRLQMGVVFLSCIYAGSGAICEDFSNNLMEIYFSKPLNWRDYVIGKCAVLLAVGLAFTAIPGVLLVLLHNLFVPSWATVQETYWWALSTVAFSLVLVVPCVMGVLASSALFASRRFASIAVFMVLVGNLVVGRMLSQLLLKPQVAVLAFPLALNRIGESLFQQRRIIFRFPVHWAWIYVAVVCVVG
ncbi:MAG: ABC transporter permease subunit, partial [Nitrospiraceae bacterium]|nr:ABC transporter permease subunit [Nitrospiraceae bacterium]